MYQWTAKKLN